jgi:hypothetical protein
MIVSGIENANQLKRYIGAAVLLFVFFLPLHFHPVAATAQAAKECTCVHGIRAQLGPAPDIATCAPIVGATLLIAQKDFFCIDEWTRLQKVRGPPGSLRV